MPSRRAPLAAKLLLEMKLTLLAALLLLPRPALSACLSTHATRLLEAEVTGCRKGDEDLRRALESFRGDHDTWVQIPQRLEGGQRFRARPYDELVGQRVRHIGGVIVRLEPHRYRELSQPPASSRKPTASPWTKFDEVKLRDYFLRVDNPDCDAVPRGKAYFVAADDCCDTVPPDDNACMLKLPAVKPPPKELEDLEAGE